MTPSNWLYAFLKNYERFRPTAYPATPAERAKGIWTIGYGHTGGVKENDTCTLQQAEEWLHQDVVNATVQVNRFIHVPLTQAQFDALVSLVFNLGMGRQDGVKGDIADSTLLHKLNAKDYAGAAAEFKKWDHQAGKELPGLLSRRTAEAAHFMGQS